MLRDSLDFICCLLSLPVVVAVLGWSASVCEALNEELRYQASCGKLWLFVACSCTFRPRPGLFCTVLWSFYLLRSFQDNDARQRKLPTLKLLRLQCIQ